MCGRDNSGKRTGKYHSVPVRVSDPEFPIAVFRPQPILQYISVHPLCTTISIVEVIQLEPEDHTVSNGKGRVTQRSVVMRDIPLVQLQNEPVARIEPLVMLAAMPTRAT